VKSQLLVIITLVAVIATSCRAYSPQRPPKNYKCNLVVR